MQTKQFGNGLIVAIAIFIALDIGVLASNYWVSRKMENDAVAINLAGRQRMLSQQVTKAAVLASALDRSADRAASAAEAREAFALFRKTLAAFASGGVTTSGDGAAVQLEPVAGKPAGLLREVEQLVEPWPIVPAEGSQLQKFSVFMVEHNGEILQAMNRFTSELEQKSIEEISRLRLAQSFAFLLSLINFFLILFVLTRARRRAEIDALTDALTGLRNRAGFYLVLDSALKTHAKGSDGLTGVILIDLDDFKAVNDTYGHAAGDEVLVETAQRLTSRCPMEWTVARLGGDEFAVVCPAVNDEIVSRFAHGLRDSLSHIPARELQVSASVGWALGRGESSGDAIVAVADDAMYSMKQRVHSPRGFRASARQ